MKYEPVFGDQSLFDGAPSDSTHATKRGGFYRVTEDGGVQYLSRGPLNGNMCKCIGGYLIAERRIIAEPKRWTLEDQKAGRLPEVGCRVDFCHKLNTNWRTGEIKYIDNQVAVIKVDDIDRPFVYEFNRVEFKPIETPEEKAARLREEWCIKALSSCSILSGMQKYELKRLGGYIEDIYDALLSGDLPVPGKEQL